MFTADTAVWEVKGRRRSVAFKALGGVAPPFQSYCGHLISCTQLQGEKWEKAGLLPDPEHRLAPSGKQLGHVKRIGEFSVIVLFLQLHQQHDGTLIKYLFVHNIFPLNQDVNG